MQLQDDLRNVGVNVEVSSEIYEKYVIIDNDIVWFGNINILGKDKTDENIMRIVDRSIATELEYKSFNKSKKLTEIQIITNYYFNEYAATKENVNTTKEAEKTTKEELKGTMKEVYSLKINSANIVCRIIKVLIQINNNNEVKNEL